MMLTFRTLPVLFLLSLSLPSIAGTRIILFGGGAGPDSSIDSVNTMRCGFVTVPDDRQSEGCTVEDDETRYRDFSSYFFAAIDGKTHLGKPLSGNPDINSNGIVNFREAYFYAVEEAYARAVPRSTSEYFLELWQPWYIRWLPFDLSKINNEFKHLATRLAAKLGMAYSPGQDGFLEAIHADRVHAESSYRDVNNTLVQLKESENEVRAKLKTQINIRWPVATNVYTESYLIFFERDLPDLNQWLLVHPDYMKLA